MQAVINERKTKTRAAEDIFYKKYCGKLKIYNGIDVRLSFNSLNLLSSIKILSKILCFLVCDSKLRILTSSNDTV